MHQLPRTPDAEEAAHALMRELETSSLRNQSKMYGVLLAADAHGRPVTLRAYSGRVDGETDGGGWVPPVPGSDTSIDEARTFARLERISEAIAKHRASPVVAAVREIESSHEARIKAFNAEVQRARHARECGVDSSALPTGHDGGERHRLRAMREAELAPLRSEYESTMRAVKALRTERTELSRALHQRMRDAYLLPNPSGHERGLAQAHDSPRPLRGGVGQCCAPKLLVAATRRGLRPVAMAEFWWGAASKDGKRQPGEFYGPCVDRCQPLMGHLLCDGGLRVVYQDVHLLVVDKPAGLPSVPGRSSARHDSVQTRAQIRFPNARAAHRLDVDTSGLLLVALDKATLRALSKAFAKREVEKRYIALLEHPPSESEGLVELRSGPDHTGLSRQSVQHDGRLGRTRWRVLDGSRVEFRPVDGRTHQIRLAARHGLGVPIVGDRLYGCAGERLMLHAESLSLSHPTTGDRLELRAPAPF